MEFVGKARLDRAITIGLVHPLLRTFGAWSGRKIPILMYHAIREPRGGGHPYFETSTSPEVFAMHMQFLAEQGYKTADLETALAVKEGSGGTRKEIVITFDDGYRDFFTMALPVLIKYHFTATIFVVSGWAQEARLSRNGAEYMSWSEIREAHSTGMRIGSHTATHPELQRVSKQRLDRELKESKQALEDKLGASVTSFAYPFAFPEQDSEFLSIVKDALQRHGYENGVSTIIGTAGLRHDRFFLPRLPVNSYDDLALFEAKLERAYDWLHAPQRLYKGLFKRSVSGVASAQVTA